MRETNKRENSLSVLAECEQYVKQIIFVNSFISTSIRMLMVYISGIYLKQDLDASPFMIGIAGFFITGCSVLRFYAMPILTFYVSYDYNTTLRHAIQIIICLASVASVVLALWVVTSSFYLGFLAVFVNGFLTIGCPPIVCEVLILVFKIDLDDDSIGKLIGILQAISSLVASLTVFGVGVIWHLSADVVVYVLIANGLVIAMLGLLIVVVTSTFQGTQPFKIGDGSNNDAHYQAITKEKSNETVAMST
eukprot:158575_1